VFKSYYLSTTILSIVFYFLLIPMGFGQDVYKPMKGITLVAPPSQIGQREMEDLLEVNTEWIALVPYGFSSLDKPTIRYNLDRQWWGERDEGIIECIRLAHKNGIKVMLKPQVYIHNSWVGDVDFDNEKDWLEWEKGYSEYIHFYGKLAADNKVELFCIGTEYKKAVKKRTQFWRRLIQEVRTYYSGELIYSSNWDGYEQVPLWDDLDYIGISAYFPLTEQKTPTLNSLNQKWRPIKTKLERFAKKHNKAIVFTEYGYLSIDKCAWRGWELEKNIMTKSINEQAQANAYNSLLKTFWDEAWWGGGFLWKWFPAGMGHEGYPERDYTPQGKLSEDTIREWYGKE
jgi:hypothetical protein